MKDGNIGLYEATNASDEGTEASLDTSNIGERSSRRRWLQGVGTAAVGAGILLLSKEALAALCSRSSGSGGSWSAQVSGSDVILTLTPSGSGNSCDFTLRSASGYVSGSGSVGSWTIT